MSGHSKWANIKHRKQAVDAKRGKVFNKLVKEITVAVKNGGSDEAVNPRLKVALLRARQANMGREIIERAIKKSSGDTKENFDEILYEGYGSEGVAFLVEVMTDKKSRTLPEIKSIFSQFNGRIVETGAVSYLFKHEGIILLKGPNDPDQLLDYVVQIGAQDMDYDPNTSVIQTEKTEFHAVLNQLNDIAAKENWEITESSLQYVPENTIETVSNKSRETNGKLTEALNDHDDVQMVYSNLG